MTDLWAVYRRKRFYAAMPSSTSIPDARWTGGGSCELYTLSAGLPDAGAPNGCSSSLDAYGSFAPVSHGFWNLMSATPAKMSYLVTFGFSISTLRCSFSQMTFGPGVSRSSSSS